MGAPERQSVHLSNLFPKASGTIITMLNGAYDASSLVFFIFRVCPLASCHRERPDAPVCAERDPRNDAGPPWLR